MTVGEMHALLHEAEARGEMKKNAVRQQQISFAYGNANIENGAVTRAVAEAAFERFQQHGPNYAVPVLRTVAPPKLSWEQ